MVAVLAVDDQDGVVSVPPEGPVAAGVGSVINIVGSSVGLVTRGAEERHIMTYRASDLQTNNLTFQKQGHPR